MYHGMHGGKKLAESIDARIQENVIQRCVNTGLLAINVPGVGVFCTASQLNHCIYQDTNIIYSRKYYKCKKHTQKTEKNEM
jgi:hypothetical protein